MSKIEFEKGKYIVYTEEDKQQAQMLLCKELVRFDRIKYLMAELLVEKGQPWKNFMANISEERLNIHFNDQTSLLFDEDEIAKGKVRQQKIDENHVVVDEDGYYSYELAYRYPDIDGHDANFRLAHEMGHLMLNPSNVNQHTYDKETNTTQIAGLIRSPKGEENNPNLYYGEKIQESAINLLGQLAIRNNESADDIISGKVEISEHNSYKKCDSLVKLLVVAMRNDFDKEISFEQLMKKKIDSTIKNSDGTREPANEFFYGLLNDSSIIENEFDKYMGEGAWRQLDSAITEMGKTDIDQQRFDDIFKAAQDLIIEFSMTRMQDKYRDAELRNGKNNVPGLESKVKIIQELTGVQDLDVANVEKTASKSELSLKQRVAQYLRKHNIFMNLEFVKNLVDKQLNILPPSNQSANVAIRRLRDDFKNRISEYGSLKNSENNVSFSNPVRMSDSKKIEAIAKKMDTKTSNGR